MPKQQKAKTLSKIAFDKVCSQLEKSIQSERASASFVCGGTIPIKLEASSSSAEKAKNPTVKSSDLVTIYWDAKPDSPEEAHKLVLPGNGSDDIASSASKLQQLVSACEPAGVGKLEPRRFATTFHPADFGIIDSIEQILVPQLNLMNEELLAVRRVELELHKLDQRQSAKAIQWAAFYSDCEHEIKTINRGQCITLKYNLYVIEPVSKKFSPISLLDPTSSPLYADLKLILSTPGFLNQGGNLGIFCSHSYPRTAGNARQLLPHGLKGVDLLIYAALNSFGLKVEVLPVIVKDRYHDWDGDGDEDRVGNILALCVASQYPRGELAPTRIRKARHLDLFPNTQENGTHLHGLRM
ncbi:hypothetical protein N7488_003076 [Penicillium malachiteum]|nr:hypothetical protein N7488_003076 [Penicillium malachiteum]